MAKFIRSELSLNPKVYKKLERKKQNENIKGHLYKKWKLYAAALGIIIITTSTGLGVSLGVPWHEIFSNLKHLKLNKTAIPGKENMTEDDAFNAVLENNTKISDLKTNVKPSLFIAPSYTTTGSLTIKAKADGKYNGSVKIKITTIKQINLKDLNLNTAIPGKVNMTQEDSFDAFLANNSNIIDLKDNVAVGTFIQPTYTTSGSLVIKAIPTGKYSGNVTVTITKLTQTNLKDLNLNTSAIDGKENMTQVDAFNAVLENNTKISDLKTNVESSSFTAPSYTSIGSITITAKENSKYIGTIKVTINKIKQINLKDLNLKTTLTNPTTDKQEAFQAFLNLNQTNYPDLKNNVETGSFTAPSYNTTGKLTVNAKTNSKYNGNITVTIPKLGQTNLNILELNKTISGTENMTSINAFNEFLNANQAKYPDLKDNAIAGTFTAPNYTQSGSLIINATTTGKYTGNVTITITKLGQTNLKDLNLKTTLTNPTTDKQEAFQAFLNLNQTNYPDLKNNVETGSFTTPTYTTEGKLTVNAKTNSKYNGNITVTIPKLGQTNLNMLELNKTISGTENMTSTNAFNEFLNANQAKYPDLKDNTIAGTFTAPNYTQSGSLIINATTTGKYTGNVTITITKLGQTNLKDLNLKTTLTNPTTDKQEAFQAFLNLNQTNYPDLKNNVETSSFTAPTYTTEGKLTVNAKTNSKYNGNITVTITKLGQTNLNMLELNKTISGTENMTSTNAFNEFLNANQTKYPDLKDNTIAGTFTAPNYTQSGSLIINATTTGKYTGNVTITITKLGQTNLKDLNLNTSALTGKVNMTEADAFNEFLSNNNNITDLKDNVEAGTFTAPSYNSTGKLTINAKTNSKYSGSIEVLINKIEQADTELIYQLIKNYFDQHKEILIHSSLNLPSVSSLILSSYKGIIKGILESNNFEFIESDWQITVPENAPLKGIIKINYLDYPTIQSKYSIVWE